MEKFKFDEKLLKLKWDAELCIEVDCTDEENAIFLDTVKQNQQLPLNIVQKESSPGKFYRLIPLNLTEKEFYEYHLLKQTKLLETIEKCVVFFTILTVISIIAGVLLGLTLI